MGLILHLPPTLVNQGHLLLTGEYRLRFERRQDKDFNAATPDNRQDLLQRLRLSAKYDIDSHTLAFAQYQYAHTEAWTPALNGSDESSDLLQLYYQYNRDGNRFTLGRQKVLLGSERLIGSSEWVNRSRSFDGVRYQEGGLDAFALGIGVQNNRPSSARLYGATYKWREGTTGLIYKHDFTTAKVDVSTLTHYAKRPLLGLELEFEGALQFGRNAGKDQEAWAYHLAFAKQLAATRKLNLEWNVASGGSNATTNRTFDPLYGTNHKFYGVMDMHGWKNLNQVAFTYSEKVCKDIDVKTRLSQNWLQDSRDAWYAASGAANTRPGGTYKDATGASGRDLGLEWDFEAAWQRNAKETISGGFAFYAPGNFVKALSGQRPTQYFGFVQYALKF